MNKKVLLLLLMLPIFIYAKDCNRNKHDEFEKLSNIITYDNKYDNISGNYTIILYNMVDGMYAELDGKKYEPNNENIVTIDGVKQGQYAFIDIFGSDGCGSVKIITISEKYYNPYYNTYDCAGYENKIVACSSQFTDAKVTKSQLELAKENYDNAIDNDEKKEEVVEEESIFSKIKEIFLNWGIKILLVVFTIFIASTIFGSKFRKIKHGI